MQGDKSSDGVTCDVMIRVEVTGAGPCSGLLLLPPKTAARWQAVRRQLACHQLVVMAETLLQLAEKHCRKETSIDEPPSSTIPSVQLCASGRNTGQAQSGTETALLPSAAPRGLPDQPGFSGATAGGPLCDLSLGDHHQGPEVIWGHGVTSGQPSTSQLTAAELTAATGRNLPEGAADAPRVTVVTLNRAEGALWKYATSSHVESHAGTARDHVTSHTTISRDYAAQSVVSRDFVGTHSGVSRDQQVSVILSAESLDRTIDQAVADERLVVPVRSTTPVPNLPQEPPGPVEDTLFRGRDVDGSDFQTTGLVHKSTAGLGRGSERRPARPPGSARPCVLRRGRAICSTDGLTIDDAANAAIEDAAGQTANGCSKRTNNITDIRGIQGPVSNSHDSTICYSGSTETCAPSASTSDDQNLSPHQDQDTSPTENGSVQPVLQTATQVETIPEKMSPPSLCSDCDTEHNSAACPLQHTRCWAQDSPGGCAAETLPACLRVDGSTVRAGPDGLAAYTLLGPLVGREVRPEQLAESVDLRHIWEVYGEGVFLDTSDPATSSWFHLLRPVARRSQRTLAVVTRQRRLFAVTTCHLAAGSELTYWQDDPEPAWRGKNMLKTRCGGCNVRFDHPLYYRRHCSLFHEPGTPLTVRKYYCKVCGEGVLGRQRLLRHAVENHDGAGAYQCQHCGKFFRRLSYLELHRNHGCAANPQRTHPLCHLCGARFSQPQKLKAHIRRAHSDPAPSLADCRCPRCGRLLGSRTALRRHLREVHPSPERPETTLSCRRCSKQFQNPSNLKVHMLTHSGVKPFRCSIVDCVSAFTTKQCLQQHYGRVHHLTGGAVPPITRAVPYTLRGYSGHLAETPLAGRRRLLCRGDRLRFPDFSACVEETDYDFPTSRGDRLRFPGFSVSRDLPEPSSGPRLLQDASRSELDSIEPSLILGSGEGGGQGTEM